jgi:uncharacterized protein YbjT (DUF2867 family)
MHSVREKCDITSLVESLSRLATTTVHKVRGLSRAPEKAEVSTLVRKRYIDSFTFVGVAMSSPLSVLATFNDQK